MAPPYKLTIPLNVGEFRDHLGWMILSSPDFTHDMFPGADIDTAFAEFFGGLRNIRKKLGENRFQKLYDMGEEMKLKYQENDVRAGNVIAENMEEILKDL